MKLLLAVLSAVVLLTSCNSGTQQNNDDNASSYKDAVNQMNPSNVHKVTVLESIDAGTYTYIRVNEKDRKYWAAISAQPVQVGQQYYYKDGMEMNNFTSKQLERTFDTIYFIQSFSEQPFIDLNQKAGYSAHDNTKTDLKKEISVDAPENGVQLADLFKNKDKYNQQVIAVRGIVVKMNKMIMGRNWIHIQDGSSFENAYDLTITTAEDMNFAIGDTITVQGTLSLNKDFGAGYSYEFILEDASILK